jgi:hypothetical protein
MIRQGTAVATFSGMAESIKETAMLFRFTRFWVALGLLIAMWGMARMRTPGDAWVRQRPTSPPGVKITQFYASVGTLIRGEKALLCYGVENARAVRILPQLDGLVYPSPNHCLQIVPKHTTHYVIQAEGFDGRVAIQSFTLPVSHTTPGIPRDTHFAAM